MTSNQIAYMKAQEEARKNREAERQKDYQLGIDLTNAKSKAREATASMNQAWTQHMDVMNKADSYEPAWAKTIKDVAGTIAKLMPWGALL